MRRLILGVHLSVALIAGLFILVLGLTGSILAFEPELDRLFHPHLSYVKPGGSVLSLGEIGEAVSKQFNGEPIVAYLPSESPDLSSAVILPSGIVCVNQYTGEVLGTRARGQSIFGLDARRSCAARIGRCWQKNHEMVGRGPARLVDFWTVSLVAEEARRAARRVAEWRVLV